MFEAFRRKPAEPDIRTSAKRKADEREQWVAGLEKRSPKEERELRAANASLLREIRAFDEYAGMPDSGESAMAAGQALVVKATNLLAGKFAHSPKDKQYLALFEARERVVRAMGVDEA